MHLVKHRSMLKHRIHATLITFGHPCPVTDLFGVAGRELLERLAIPQPWRGTVDASLRLIDDLDRQIDDIKRELRAARCRPPLRAAADDRPRDRLGAGVHDRRRDRRHRPLRVSRKKLCGYTGLCPRVNQSGDRDRRGPLTKQGPKYLRWAMLEATMHALRHPAYRERYQRNKRRLGRQRGAKVAQIDIARKLTEAIWHMLTNNQPFAPPREAPLFVWPPDGPYGLAPPEPASNVAWSSRRGGDREMSAARHPTTARGPNRTTASTPLTHRPSS